MIEPYQEEVDAWEQQQYQQPEPEWGGGDCPFCGKMSHYFGGKFAECEECGKTHKDLEDK